MADCPASYAAACFTIGTKAYVGTGGDIGVNDFWEWDQSNNTWTQKNNFGGSPRRDAVGFSIEQKGYIATGHDPLPPYHDYDLWEYNPSTDGWTQLEDLPADGRANPVSFVIGNLAYIATGENAPMYNDLWEYCPLSSCATEIHDLSVNSNMQVEIYPTNFTSEIFIIVTKQDLSYLSISIKDLTGRELFNREDDCFNSHYNLTINLSCLSSGIYLMELISDNDKSITKIVRE